jgi:pectate lyase
MRRKRLVVAVGLLLAQVAAGASAVPAFSGAEGWGAVTPGGRGGQVLHVTNLNDSGPGSFREAATASGPRTVVFDVSGQINLLSEVSVTSPYLTIAGQTAPGDGITIAGETTSLDASDIIIRHVRFRRGKTDNTHESALTHDGTTGNIIVDHVSASWGLDETLSLYRNKINPPIIPGGSTILPARNITIQWSIVSEALNAYNHAFGSTLGGVGANQHHNLWASNTGRNPSISFSHLMDFRNNVIFNWMHRSMDGAGEEAHVNVINNYYKPGPATGYTNTTAHTPIPELKFRIVKPEIRHFSGPGGVGYWYVDGNYVEGYPTISADNWEGVMMVDGLPYHGVQFDNYEFENEWARVNEPHTVIEPFDDPDDPNDDVNGVPIPIPPLPKIATQTAQNAYSSVLAGAGASLVRDAVDLRVVNSVATGVATAGPRGDGIITDISQVGGYPVIPLVTRDANFDTDQDGMPNEWEARHGLNSANAGDRNGDFDTDGYTNLEEYLNDIGTFQAVEDVVWDGGNGRYALIENWSIAFQPSRLDTAAIDSGVVAVDAIGQHAGSLKLGTSASNSPTLHITAGRLEVADSLLIGAHATAAATLNLTGGVLEVGLLDQGAAGTFNFSGGTLAAEVVDFDLVNNGGTIAPGHSAGAMQVNGDLTINSGTLEIEIGGTGVNDFDHVSVSGQAHFEGVLDVDLIDGFTPAWGDDFEIASATEGIEGGFTGFDLPALAEGLGWSVSSNGDALVLSAVLAGDYNADGMVDAVDYTVWRNSIGGTLVGETASFGVVDAADYAEWKNNYGATVALGSGGLASVPEPQALAALIVGLSIFSLGPRFRRPRRRRFCVDRPT